MRKRLSSFIISTALIVSLTTGALAADPSAMEDISGHWAQDAISWCMVNDLFQGMSDTSFEPETPMTRGMFVVVLGRIAGINEDDYRNSYLSTLYTDVQPEHYFAPYVNWATRYGIVNGIGDGSFQPYEPVTREQMAAMVIRFTSIYNYALTGIEGNYSGTFTDGDEISTYAADAVESLRQTGILNGFPADDGTCYFGPQRSATRAECATVFQRLMNAMRPYEGRELVDPTGFSLQTGSAEMKIGQTMPMIATITPANATNQTITWVSMNPRIATVDHNGTVTAVSEGTTEIYGYTWNGLYQCCTITCVEDVSLAYAGETYEEKCIRIFGKVVDDPRTYYDSEASGYEKATDHLVEIAVRVWDFTDSSHTSKYTKTIYLQVHENIADTVKAIFEEIYNGDEKFPIASAGGYYESFKSEHHPGLAIDINPNSNYYCYPDGTAITGSHWDPENDPYSIPLEGDVADAFAKYGFTRGIYWRSGYKDYMHFSYFGT